MAVRQRLKILINWFLVKKVLTVGGLQWVLVDISWLVASGGWWWMVLGSSGWWWVVMNGGGWWHSLV